LFKPYKSYKFKTRWVQLELFNSYLLSQNAIDFVIPTKEESHHLNILWDSSFVGMTKQLLILEISILTQQVKFKTS